jgi:hypothetical protein
MSKTVKTTENSVATAEQTKVQVNPETEKLIKFRANLKVQKQINPAIRKVQIALRAVTNLKKKTIVADFIDDIEQAEDVFKVLETKLLGLIPD